MSAWQDRFTTPQTADLDAGIHPDNAPAYQALRNRLEALDHLTPEIRWMGIPWRWTYVYVDESGTDTAFLIPEPTNPALAMPLPLNRAEDLDAKRLAKTVREGLARARVVGDIAWPEWELSSVSAATELGKFIAKLEREPANA
ncbi:MAG: hypothetical protein DHS20C14_16850 [Phycisphaeraceae bacterium]|nr:MAG: hypothetical protein DHS20C14_16850 [Phycisphaeraceae bacterium]